MRLVPRQLRRSDFSSSVPYYGGRLTPEVIAGLGAAPAVRAAPAPAPPPRPAPPVPQASVEEQLATLTSLRDQGVLTDDEYQTLRARIVDES